jgi:uncharacterized repeat protein (TIGR01451 family)/fimbrial isopeptide formation D2 family protein
MEKKAGLGICIIIVLMLIMTSFVSALNLNPLEKRNQFDFYPFKIICDPYPQFDAFKQVWNGSAWVDECSVINGSIVRFNITVEYHDIDPEDHCYMVSQIEIIDDLGDFEYIGNPWISESGINPDNYLIFDPITNIYKWNFYNNITLSEKLSSYNRTLYFEFDAKANTEGTLVNNVCINGTEHCCNQPCSSEANATVYVEPEPYPNIDLTKYVKDNNIWNKTTTVKVGNDVEFKIIVNNTGNTIITSYAIKDDLPTFLTYNNDANITPSSSSAHHLQWNLTNLSINKTIEIVFTAHANATGEDDNYANVTTYEGPYDDDIAHVIVEETPIGELLCEKKVWDPDTQQWAEQINADIGDTIRFNITLTYTGDGVFMNIKVKDILPPCLQYANNASPVETGKSNNIIFWNLSNILQNGQNLSIEFDALVISSGTNINTANITGIGNCIQPLYCEDTATVIVKEIPHQDLICEKKVWDPDTQQWAEQINADIGDTIRFNITLTYTGDGVFMNIKVKDILPPCLQYANNASPVETGKSNNIIFWNLSNILQNGQNLSIEFDALVISSGTNINTANITGIGNCIQPLYCEDTATVIVKEIPHQDLICEKKVWDPDTQQWAEVINADIGDTVRFKITISYQGSLAFYSIWVNDTLPTCLKYNNNATPNEPVINGKKLTWFLDLFLRYGQNKSIEFDTLVISGGENINVVNITGWECGIHRLFCEDTATVIVMEPLIAEAGGPYTGYVGDPIQITGSATGGIPDYVYKWDLNNDGVYDDANGKTISHSWTTQGTKTIYLKVTDSMDKNDTDPATVTVNIRNQPPNTPSTPEGKATIKINKENAYTTLTTDPNGDQIWYWIDWGDETNSGWVGPFASGATATASHIWTKRGTYQIKVKAKDSYNVESAYSGSFEVKVKFLVSQSVQIPTILQKLIERFPMLERFFYHYFSFSF